MNLEHILVGIMVIINLVAFLLMASDKRASIHGNNRKRAPEGKLFFWAIIGGGVGVYLGMLAFRHKTKKWYFQVGILLLVVQQVIAIYYVQLILNG